MGIIGNILVTAAVVGGLGNDQTADVRAALPAEVLQWAPPKSDAYEDTGEILDFIRSRPAHFILLGGHSLGCDTAIKIAKTLAAEGIKNVGVILIEPVWAKKKKPPCILFRWLVSDAILDFPRADVEGATAETICGTDHNTICQDVRTIQIFSDIVNKLVSSSASPAPDPTPARDTGSEVTA